jgi:hypothetical protein
MLRVERDAALSKTGAGRRTLKKYEVTNLLFFLVIIVALGVLVSFVFRYYGKRNEPVSDEGDLGVVSEALSPGNDVGLFYLGAKITETSRQFRSRIDVPVTDDGFLKDLFNVPGVEEITLDQRMIMIKKSAGVRWESISPGVRQIVKNHIHLHY